MRNALRAEIRKVRYQRSTYGIIAAAVALSLIGGISIIASAQLPRRQMFMSLTDESVMQLVMASTAASYIFALVLGIVVSTTEFRHSTAVATYLAQPDRRIVMAAKMVVAAVMGAIVQFMSTGLGMTAAYLYVQRYPHFALPFDAYLRIMAGSVLVGVVLGVVGVAVGSLIRSQMVAVALSILWLQLIEGLLVVFADWIGRWSMRGAIISVLDIAVRVRTPQQDIGITDTLGPWQATLLLLAYAGVFAFAAMRTTMRRDID